MPQTKGLNGQEGVCLPGDITVTQVPSGYLVGRVLPRLGPGPWWEYIALDSDLAAATRRAITLAEQAGMQAWFDRGAAGVEALGAVLKGQSESV